MDRRIARRVEKGDKMATRLLGAMLNLLSVRDVLNARDKDLSDGRGVLLRCSGPRAAWVFRYTSATGKRREMALGACVRHNARAAGESLALAREPSHQATRTAGSGAAARSREDRRPDRRHAAHHRKKAEPAPSCLVL